MHNAPVGPQDVDAGGHDEVLRDELDELAHEGEVAHAAHGAGLLACVCVCVCVCKCMCVCICVCACMNMNMCVPHRRVLERSRAARAPR